VLLGSARGLGSVVPFVVEEQIAKPVSRLVLVGIALLVGAGGGALFALWTLPTIAGFIGVAITLRVMLRRAPTEAAGSVLSVRGFWSFAGPRAFASAFEISSVWIGVVFLSALATSADAGVYTAASRYVTVGTMVMLAVRLALGPELSRLLGRGATREAEIIHQRCTSAIIVLSWPIFLFGAVFAPAVLHVFGGGFSRGSNALLVLALCNLVNLGVGNAQSVLLMVGRSSLNMWNTGAALLAQVVLGIILIPHIGVMGAAIGAGAGAVVDNVLSAIQVRRVVGLRTVTRSYVMAVSVSVAVFGGVAGVGRLALGTSISAAVVVGVICVLIYGLVLYVMRGEFVPSGPES
jgi:O-antigen/teichoic acid export membrane protein